MIRYTFPHNYSFYDNVLLRHDTSHETRRPSYRDFHLDFEPEENG